MVDVLSLVDRHDRWRADSCVNLQPSENAISPQVRRALGSDLASRYTLPWSGEIHGAKVTNAYGGTKYLDEIEGIGEALARTVFDAKHASLKPLSGHLAGMLMLLTGQKPALVILGASFFLFPYEMAPLREAADDAGTLIGYDGSHVLGLVAGGVFQRPLAEGADILVGSTHKSLFGPQGGMFLCNRDDLWERAQKNMVWRLFDNVHWNRVAGIAQALDEHQEFGKAYATQVVRNAKALAAALDERGFPVKFREHGFTASHQIHLDEDGMKRDLHLTPQEFSAAMEGNNVIVDAVARLGTNEVTRLGATPKEMGEIAELMDMIVRGKSVKEEVLALRSRLRLAYAFPA